MVLRLFQPGDAAHFRSLNEEWIRKWFGLEEQDERVLGDPEASVLGRGGQILIAEIDGIPVGCCALIPGEEGEFELAKMTVAAAYRGRGIGRRLLDYAIAEARAMGAKSLLLGSNRNWKRPSVSMRPLDFSIYRRIPCRLHLMREPMYL